MSPTATFPSEPDLFSPTRTRSTNKGSQLLSGLKRTFSPAVSRSPSRSPAPMNFVSTSTRGLYSTTAERRAPSLERPAVSVLHAPRGSAARPSIEQIAMGLHLTRARTSGAGNATTPTPATAAARTPRQPLRRASSVQQHSQHSSRRLAVTSSPNLVPALPFATPARSGVAITTAASPTKSAIKKPTMPASPERASSYPPLSPRSAGRSMFLSVPSSDSSTSQSSATSLVSSTSTGTLVPPEPPRASSSGGFKARVSRLWPGNGASARMNQLAEVARVPSRTSEEVTLASGSDDGHGGPYKRKAVRFNNSGPTVMS